MPTLEKLGFPPSQLETLYLADLIGYVDASTVVTVVVSRENFGKRDKRRFDGMQLYVGAVDSEQQPIPYTMYDDSPRNDASAAMYLRFECARGTLTYQHHPDHPAKTTRYLWKPLQQHDEQRTFPVEVVNNGSGHFTTHLGATGSLYLGPTARKVYYVGKTHGEHPQVVVVTTREGYDDAPTMYVEFFIGSLSEGLATRRPVARTHTVPLGLPNEFTLDVRSHHFVHARKVNRVEMPATLDGHPLIELEPHYVLSIDENAGRATCMG